MKVDQYEVLGNGVKEMSVPPGTIEVGLLVSSHAASRAMSSSSIVPSGTGRFFRTPTQHFVLGFYFHWVPPGRLLPARMSSLMLTRIGNRGIAATVIRESSKLIRARQCEAAAASRSAAHTERVTSVRPLQARSPAGVCHRFGRFAGVSRIRFSNPYE